MYMESSGVQLEESKSFDEKPVQTSIPELSDEEDEDYDPLAEFSKASLVKQRQSTKKFERPVSNASKNSGLDLGITHKSSARQTLAM